MVIEFCACMGIPSPCNRQSIPGSFFSVQRLHGFRQVVQANQYQDPQTNEIKRARYRLILVRGSDLRWLNRDRLQEVKTGLAAQAQHKWIPVQNLPFPEVVLYAYAADRTPFPTYVCLPSGLYKAHRTSSSADRPRAGNPVFARYLLL